MFRCRMISRILWQQRLQTRNDKCVRPCINVLANKCVREQGTVAVEDGYIKKFMKAVGWMDQSRTRLKLTGYFLYESIPMKVRYAEWFEELELPDTFASWFCITELHVWMLMVRYMAEDITASGSGKNQYVKGDGHFVRNCIIEAMWADVANKIKLLEGANPAIARKQVSELSQQFQAAIIAYDEGLSDDKVMAAAIWRRFYSLSPDTKPENVETIVKLIRHQVSLLDRIPSENLKWNPEITWLSIFEK